MLQSLCVYGFMIFSFFTLLQTGTVVKKNGQRLTKTIPFYPIRYSIALLIFAFFSGVRWDVGIDYLTYLTEYLSIQQNGFTIREDFETGYIALQEMLLKMHVPFYVYFAIIALLQFAFSTTYFRHARYLLPYFCVLIMTGGDFFSWMNAMRQAIVSTAFLLLISLTIEKKRWIVYLIALYLLTFIHKSALLLAPLLLLYYFKLEKVQINRKIQYILYFCALALSAFPLWQSLLSFAENVLSLIGLGDRFTAAVLARYQTREVNFGARRIIFLLIDLTIIAYSTKLRKVYPTKGFGFAYLMYIIFYITQSIFISSLTFSRIVGYFYTFRAVIGSYLLYYLFHIRPNKYNVLIGFLIIFLFLSHLFIQIYADRGGHTDCIRYMFFWDNFLI